MWLKSYTVTPHTYMLTALPFSGRGVNTSFRRVIVLNSTVG
jgi:hypothetical protein